MEYKSFGNKEKIRIGVMGVGRGTGETMVSLLFAGALNEMGVGVALVELAKPAGINSLIYDKLGLAKKFKNESFIDFYKLLKESGRIRGLFNIKEGINWVTITPRDVEEGISLSQEDKLRLLGNVYGEIIVVDCNNDYSVLNEFDYVIGVLDPSPGVLMKNEGKYKRLWNLSVESGNVIWIVNRYNRGINALELGGFLGVKKFHKLPCLPPEAISLSEYSLKLPGNSKEINRITQTVIKEVIKEMGIRGKHNK